MCIIFFRWGLEGHIFDSLEMDLLYFYINDCICSIEAMLF